MVHLRGCSPFGAGPSENISRAESKRGMAELDTIFLSDIKRRYKWITPFVNSHRLRAESGTSGPET